MRLTAFIVFAIFVANTFAQDPCAVYPTCADCIAAQPCGWCAVNITYSDGTSGPRCAGKVDNPGPGYKPWTCLKDYQNQACYGYVCDETFQCVSSGRPNGGVPLADCLSKCFPPTFECNQTTYQCYQVDPGHGTDKPNCEKQCQAPQPQAATTGNPSPQEQKYECNPTTYQCQPATDGGGVPLSECNLLCAQNITPIFVIGNWRGLEVSKGYVKGEWKMKVTENNTMILDPTGAVFANGQIVSKGSELWLTDSDGTRRGIFALNEVPELSVLTWALGKLNGRPPTSFDDGLATGTAFVFVRCLDDGVCQFKNWGKLVKSTLNAFNKITKNIKRASQPVDDPCSVFPDCHSCISAPSCGWCSVPVIYNNNTVGKNCAGTNSTASGRINCTGTFSTEDCTFSTSSGDTTQDSTGATTQDTTQSSTQDSTGSTTSPNTQQYKCNPLTNQCEQDPNGNQPKDVCDSQCTPNPIPPNLKGKYFRGLQVDNAYMSGEFRLYFSDTEIYLITPQGQNLTGSIISIERYIVVKFSDGSKVASIWQLQPGPATTLFSWAWGSPNGDAPESFSEAMAADGEKEFFFVSCLDGKPTSVCDFSQ